MFGNGLGNGGTSSQRCRQGKALFQRGVMLPHTALVIGKVGAAPAHDLGHEGIFRQGGKQRPEPEPVQLLAGQVDAVGLLERRYDVGRVAPVVERRAGVVAAGRLCRCWLCGLFSDPIITLLANLSAGVM